MFRVVFTIVNMLSYNIPAVNIGFDFIRNFIYDYCLYLFD